MSSQRTVSLEQHRLEGNRLEGLLRRHDQQVRVAMGTDYQPYGLKVARCVAEAVMARSPASSLMPASSAWAR